MAGSTGLEPAASGVTGRRSNQLNYDPDQVQSSKSKVKKYPADVQAYLELNTLHF